MNSGIFVAAQIIAVDSPVRDSLVKNVLNQVGAVRANVLGAGGVGRWQFGVQDSFDAHVEELARLDEVDELREDGPHFVLADVVDEDARVRQVELEGEAGVGAELGGCQQAFTVSLTIK